MKGKSLAWPPVKNLEDTAYPTASPIWIDPNPILHRLPRQNVPEKRAYIQDSCNRSQNVSRASNREEREYEQKDILYSKSGESMDNSCNKPFYRKECIETRRECRSSSLTRPESAEGMRRSLTPTRINQPMPRPWTATVTSESNAYSHVEAPVPPEPPVCRKVCTCEIVCEKTSGPGGPEHEQEHHYREIICQVCTPEPPPVDEYEEPQEPEPEEEEEEEEINNDIIDLSTVVPADIAVCPRGIENQHNMYTETMEKDEGDIHIKKTTIYEKTVELLSPSRATTPIDEQDEPARPTSSASMDREVEAFSGRHQCVNSAEIVSSAIETSRMIEEAKKEEEERRRILEEERRREDERIRREEKEERVREENRLRIIQQEKEEKQKRMEQQKKETDRRCRQEEEERTGKHVSFAGRPQGVVQESIPPTEIYESQEYIREENTGVTKTEEHYRKTKEEIQVQENYNQVEEEKCCQNLREQVEVHKCLREQQQSERRPSLQERRLTNKFRPQSAEEIKAAQAAQAAQTAAAARASESCQRKHVQFVTKTDSGMRPLPPTSVKNSTPKEWRSEMVNALTTVSDRPYSPLETSYSAVQEDTSCQSKSSYSKSIRYEEVCRPCPVQKPQPVKPPFEDCNRPVSPFTEALTTASERPYTPLGGNNDHDTVICVKRSRTPTDKTIEGYCHPAEILYTDAKARQSRSRERKLRKVEGPRPLPTPPPDYKFRDNSPSPARSLSANRPDTPSRQGVMAGLKKPGTIPSYQKYLVAEQHEAVHEHSYTPSRTPTPTPHRPKSPAPGPPEAPACYLKAHAPMIRADPPAPRQPHNNSCRSEPGQTEKISYHLEEDTAQGHVSKDYIGTCTSYYENSQQDNQSCSRQQQKYQRVEEKSVVPQSKPVTTNWDGTGCGLSKTSSYQSSLPCPIEHAPPSRPTTPCQSKCNYASSHSQSAISERVQKTGVRVLPPCPKAQQTQVCETRRVYHSEEEQTMAAYNPKKSGHQESDCPNTGVTVLPCRAITGSGASRAGVVIVPCEGEDNTACPRSGIRITPTPDRSGLCVSPATHGRSSSSCSGKNKTPRSGGNEIDVGNCPASGVRVGTCTDGSVCVAPCKVPGVSSVAPPKPILKTQCPATKAIPFPHIPLPCKKQQEPNPCDSCPLNAPNQSDKSFQPINQQPCTNLSNQLTRLTIKRDKHAVQLFKPQAQSSSQQQCDDGKYCELQQSQLNQTRSSQYTSNTRNVQNLSAPTNLSSQPDLGCGLGGPGPKSRRVAGSSSAPTRGRGILNQAGTGGRQPLCASCNAHVR